MKNCLRLLALALLASASCISTASAAPDRIKIRLAPMPGIGHLVPELAMGLGYFEQEGIDVELVNVMNYRDDDFYSTELLNDGTMDAEICWYQRVVFGIGNDQPAQAVLLIENSPHLTISVASRLRDQIRTVADFKGRTIVDSEGFSTRRYLTDIILERAGMTPADYTPAPGELSQKLPLLTKALEAGQVDIVACMEPTTTKLLATNLVTPLYDLSTAEGTRSALGEVWPARCLYFCHRPTSRPIPTVCSVSSMSSSARCATSTRIRRRRSSRKCPPATLRRTWTTTSGPRTRRQRQTRLPRCSRA